MNEAEWLSCADPTLMLEHLRGKVSDRKLRLFACACCRQHHRKFADEGDYREAIETIEQHVDGMASPQEWKAAKQTLIRYTVDDRRAPYDDQFWADGWEMASDSNFFDPSFEDNYRSNLSAEERMNRWNLVVQRERNWRADVLRDLIGNPFRGISIDPASLQWDDAIVPQLAQSIYDDRRFEDLPILADALMDAGCHDEAILSHCRSPGPHVLGCWVLDLLLGKQ